MRKMTNTYHLEGQLYDQSLEIRTTGANSKTPGTEYIRGDIQIATDSKRTNIIRVTYTYVVASQGGGRTWNALKEIIDGKRKTYMAAGDEAAFVRIDTQLAVNDFLPRGGNEIVTQLRNEGGFIHFIDPAQLSPVTKENPNVRNKFTIDCVITKTTFVEADPDLGTRDRLLMKAAAFNFRNEIVPVELTVYAKEAIDYFEGQEISAQKPLFIEIRGTEEASTVIIREEKENVFGAPEIIERQRSTRAFVVTGASSPYTWDDEGTITADEWTTAIGNRNTALATVKEQAEQRATQAAKPSSAAAKVANTASGDFLDF